MVAGCAYREVFVSHRILVTGASSALGRAIGRSLRASGHYSVGTVRSGRIGFSLPMFDEVVTLNLDGEVSQNQIEKGFDAIIHAAAAVNGPRETLMEVTGLGTESLARAAIANGIPRLVHVSSTSVYGGVVTNHISSGTSIKPQTDYGVAKWAAECYLHDLEDEISSVSVRSPAIVGEQVSQHFLQRILNQMCARHPRIRASNPDFLFNNVIHEDSLAGFLVHLAVTKMHRFRAFPVGSIQDVNLRELLSFMSQAEGYEGQIDWSQSRDIPFSVNLDDALELGFQPLTTLETIQRWMAA